MTQENKISPAEAGEHLRPMKMLIAVALCLLFLDALK